MKKNNVRLISVKPGVQFTVKGVKFVFNIKKCAYQRE